MKRMLHGVLMLAACYAGAVALTAVLHRVLVEGAASPPVPMAAGAAPGFMLAFVVFFAPLLALFCRALAGSRIRIRPAELAAYAGVITGCAMATEVAVNAAFMHALGRPCWSYHVLPVHGGSTSAAGLVMWPLYGAFTWGLHAAIAERWPGSAWLTLRGKALLVGLDAMALEILANTFTLVVGGSWYFLYSAGDLHHFTAGEILVPYVLAGWAGHALLGRLMERVHHGLLAALGYAAGVAVALAGM